MKPATKLEATRSRLYVSDGMHLCSFLETLYNFNPLRTAKMKIKLAKKTIFGGAQMIDDHIKQDYVINV